MKTLTLLSLSFLFYSCGFAPQSTSRDKTHVYRLPFETGKKVLMVQAYKSLFSHINDIALDFKVKKGTRICAARAGIVIATKEDSHKHGLSAKYLAEGNHIMIEHDDGSIAWYWHLQHNGVAVNLGQRVEAGEYIGLSGHTGFSAFPHLHFEVRDRNGKQIFTRFYTESGIEYLKAGRFYRAVDP